MNERFKDDGKGTPHSSNNQEGHKPLSIKEIEELRKILQARERYKWLHGTLKLWIGYISGGLVTLYVIWDYAEKLIDKILR